MRSAERRKVNVLEKFGGSVANGQLGMKRCVGAREQKLSQRVEQIREYGDGLGMWEEWMNTVWPEGY